jgi:hypothetical protein
MKLPTEKTFKQIDILSQRARQQFLEKGVVIPSQDADGKIHIGRYIVDKNAKGFFTILDNRKNIIVDGINLAQTAILLSNRLALGKMLDTALLEKDRKYGYALFEETLQKQALARSHDVDKICLLINKLEKSTFLRESYQRYIVSNFEKLKKIT